MYPFMGESPLGMIKQAALFRPLGSFWMEVAPVLLSRGTWKGAKGARQQLFA